MIMTFGDAFKTAVEAENIMDATKMQETFRIFASLNPGLLDKVVPEGYEDQMVDDMRRRIQKAMAHSAAERRLAVFEMLSKN